MRGLGKVRRQLRGNLQLLERSLPVGHHAEPLKQLPAGVKCAGMLAHSSLGGAYGTTDRPSLLEGGGKAGSNAAAGGRVTHHGQTPAPALVLDGRRCPSRRGGARGG
ncbi:hypothetical protein D3C72_1250460 [compost metagenome]